ncbi:hypothetical protein NDU88_005848 [Pleurodeles waltl]|uniref:Uncharacterized protein n=1 Tax=Pleurodeles waltl TaxID=8319 RepID=A0AAV7TDE5_PLEWA|nr:hypothetical protein NDU88_005848 [Pleurodeles waltl]
MSHSNYTTKCDAKDSYVVEAHADALFPRKKRKYGSPVERIDRGKTIEDKSPERQRKVERLSGSAEEGGPRDKPWTPCDEERLDWTSCGRDREAAGSAGAPLLAHLTRRDWNIKEYD